jgi:hypothetical protein
MGRILLAPTYITLADAFLLPLIHDMRLMQDSSGMVGRTASSTWKTEPPPMPGRS